MKGPDESRDFFFHYFRSKIESLDRAPVGLLKVPLRVKLQRGWIEFAKCLSLQTFITGSLFFLSTGTILDHYSFLY